MDNIVKEIKRMSWVDAYLGSQSKPLKKEYLFLLDDILYQLWALGKNINI